MLEMKRPQLDCTVIVPTDYLLLFHREIFGADDIGKYAEKQSKEFRSLINTKLDALDETSYGLNLKAIVKNDDKRCLPDSVLHGFSI